MNNPTQQMDKRLKRYLTKENIEMANMQIKDAPHNVSSGNRKLKQQWDTTTRPLITRSQNTNNTKSWSRYGGTGTLINCWWGSEMVQPLRKTMS